MSEAITIYEKPTCSTCREADKILRESGVDYDKINYYVEPLSATKIEELIKKMGITARQLLRTKDPLFAELNLANPDLPEKQIIELMAKHPDLIQRPIVERGSKAVLGRPVENIKTFLQP